MSKIDDFEDRVEKRLEAIWNKLDGLPCAGRGERLASVEKGQWFLWALLLLLLGSAGTFIHLMVEK